MWKNAMEIEELVISLGNDPKFGEAARFLNSWKDYVNSVSDGWHSWRAGSKCAEPLSDLLDNAMAIKRGWGLSDRKEPTPPELKKAMNKIRTFSKTNKWLKATSYKFEG